MFIVCFLRSCAMQHQCALNSIIRCPRLCRQRLLLATNIHEDMKVLCRPRFLCPHPRVAGGDDADDAQVAVVVLTIHASGQKINVKKCDDSDYNNRQSTQGKPLQVLKYQSYLDQQQQGNTVTCTCNIPQIPIGVFAKPALRASPFCPTNSLDPRTKGLPDTWCVLCVRYLCVRAFEYIVLLIGAHCTVDDDAVDVALHESV